jgi:hypothetical protein
VWPQLLGQGKASGMPDILLCYFNILYGMIGLVRKPFRPEAAGLPAAFAWWLRSAELKFELHGWSATRNGIILIF